MKNRYKTDVDDFMFIGDDGELVGPLYGVVQDNKIFVFEDESLVSEGIIEVKAIYSNPTDISTYVDDDTSDYPIPDELLSVLTQEIISKEVSLLYNLSANTPNNQTDEKTKSKEVQR